MFAIIRGARDERHAAACMRMGRAGNAVHSPLSLRILLGDGSALAD
jgi:hypothetical protein